MKSRLARALKLGPTRLRDRISLVVTFVAGVFLLVSAAWWGATTRSAIHEEVDASTRVAEQWLSVLAREAAETPDGADVLLMRIAAAGHLRATNLEVHNTEGKLMYRAPPAVYKSGRAAPAWFARLISPEMAVHVLAAGELRLELQPDTSRSVLDAWDELVQIAGWTACLLLAIAFVMRFALDRALAPLADLDRALARTAGGAFDLRLPRRGVAELDTLADSYNAMAEQLEQTLVRNARLEEDKLLAAHLEAQRRMLARELHDELGQSITAVRAIAGAIAQRSTDQAGLHGNAQAILALTGQMHDGVHAILQRMRTGNSDTDAQLAPAIEGYCDQWAALHPQVRIERHLGVIDRPLDERYSLTLLRLLQESLTNVARHAQARQVQIHLRCDDAGIALEVVDDGRGLAPDLSSDAGRRAHYGMLGMRERVAEWHGEICFEQPAVGGTRVCARLPWPETMTPEQSAP